MESLKVYKPPVEATECEESLKLLVVVGITREKELSIEAYDFGPNVWLKGPRAGTVESVDNIRLAIHGKKIYCFDGYKLKSADINLDAAEMAWVDCEANWYPRHYSGLCCSESTIYVAGGLHTLSTAESFDISTGRSKRIAEMLVGRHYFGLGTLNGQLYALGGWTAAFKYSACMECYDPNSDSWQAMPPMSGGRWYPGVGALGGELIVVEGQREKCVPYRSVEAFIPANRTWRRLPDLIFARSFPGLIAVKDQFFVIGGWNPDDGYLNTVELYNGASNSWSLLARSMHTGKAHVSAALIDKSVISHRPKLR